MKTPEQQAWEATPISPKNWPNPLYKEYIGLSVIIDDLKTPHFIDIFLDYCMEEQLS